MVILAEDDEVSNDGEITMLKEDDRSSSNNNNNNNNKSEKKSKMACQWMDLSICTVGGMTMT